MGAKTGGESHDLFDSECLRGRGMAIASADKNEACAALVPGANPNGGGEFSASGNFIRNSIRGDSGGGGGGSGCCRFGADCGDCGHRGLDGTGWCHQSAMTWEVYRSLAFQLPRKMVSMKR